MNAIDLTARLDSDIRAIPLAIDGISGVAIPYVPANVRVSPSNLQNSAQATINAFDASQSAQDNWTHGKQRDTSIQYMVSLPSDARAYRAVVAVAIDEINLLREWIMSFKAATAAATSLADFKTRVAALDDLPDRTMVQAKAAFSNKINADT